MARKKAEEQEPEENSWSGLKKTIIGTLTTVIAGGGVWLSTTLFGGSDEPKEETKTDPAGQAPVIVNVQQNQENKQKVENGGNTVIRERVIEKPATQEAPKPKKEEEESW
jgi:flagellar basal body-associated protein FliL